jgi:uncharacterized protein
VLLALYPTVMLLTILVSPLMQHLPLAVQMLVGNVLSIILLTWLVMPGVGRLLRFWLATPISGAASGGRWKMEVLGVSIVAVSIALFVLIFWVVG